MKLSITVRCHCGEPLRLQTSGTQLPKDRQCPKCHTALWFIQPLGNFVGVRILSRASSELESGDFTLVIMLSAMAVECEMQRLFIKWKGIDLMRATATGMPTPADEDVWAEEWRKFFRIATRLDELSKLLAGQDFDSFLSHNRGLLNAVHTRYSSFSAYTRPKDLFRQELFNKRNKIVHHGEIDFSQADGEMCFALASTLMEIMKEMDAQRLRSLDATLAAERLKPTPNPHA